MNADDATAGCGDDDLRAELVKSALAGVGQEVELRRLLREGGGTAAHAPAWERALHTASAWPPSSPSEAAAEEKEKSRHYGKNETLKNKSIPLKKISGPRGARGETD